jgi:hypothetical protein
VTRLRQRTLEEHPDGEDGSCEQLSAKCHATRLFCARHSGRGRCFGPLRVALAAQKTTYNKIFDENDSNVYDAVVRGTHSGNSDCNTLSVGETLPRRKPIHVLGKIFGSERRFVRARRLAAVLRRKFSGANKHGTPTRTQADRRSRFFNTNKITESLEDVSFLIRWPYELLQSSFPVRILRACVL